MASSMLDTDEPVKIPIPISLTATTPSLPPLTQQALISHLRAAGAIPELSSLLSDSLARAGWIDRVRALSLELLRNGTCDTFPDLMTEVLRRAKIPKTPSSAATDTKATKTPAKTNGTVSAAGASAVNGINGAGAISVSKEWSGGPDGLPDVRIPETSVEAAVEFLKEKIMDVIEVVDDDSD